MTFKRSDGYDFDPLSLSFAFLFIFDQRSELAIAYHMPLPSLHTCPLSLSILSVHRFTRKE